MRLMLFSDQLDESILDMGNDDIQGIFIAVQNRLRIKNSKLQPLFNAASVAIGKAYVATKLNLLHFLHTAGYMLRVKLLQIRRRPAGPMLRMDSEQDGARAGRTCGG